MQDGQQSFYFATTTCGLQSDQHHKLVRSSEIHTLPKIHAIYRIVCIVTLREYIGSATVLRSRIQAHYRHLVRNSHCNLRLQREFNKYGESSFGFGVLEEVSDKNQLIPREQHYFDTRKPALILCKMAGRNPTGRKMSAYSKMKLSIAHKGRTASEATRRILSIARRRWSLTIESRIKQSMTWKEKLKDPNVRASLIESQRRSFLGKHLAAETRNKISQKYIQRLKDPSFKEKMSEACKKRSANPSYRAKISNALKGRPLSASTRLALSKAHKGVPWSEARRAAHNLRFKSKQVCEDC